MTYWLIYFNLQSNQRPQKEAGTSEFKGYLQHNHQYVGQTNWLYCTGSSSSSMLNHYVGANTLANIFCRLKIPLCWRRAGMCYRDSGSSVAQQGRSQAKCRTKQVTKYRGLVTCCHGNLTAPYGCHGDPGSPYINECDQENAPPWECEKPSTLNLNHWIWN